MSSIIKKVIIVVYELDGKEYIVKIERKANKNTYIRFKNDFISVTTSYFVTNRQIVKLLDSNQDFLRKNIFKNCQKKEKDENNIILGEKYDIIIINNVDEIDYENKKIYLSSISKYDSLIKKETKKLFEERLKYNYNLFEEKIKFPLLRIRKMKTRWGVCNRRDIRITLNSDLFKYGIEEIDYVIVHELSHLIVFNHSKEFWNVVVKYCPNYKKIRKRLKE